MRVLREPGDQSNKKQCAKTLGGARGVLKVVFWRRADSERTIVTLLRYFFEKIRLEGLSLRGVKNQMGPYTRRCRPTSDQQTMDSSRKLLLRCKNDRRLQHIFLLRCDESLVQLVGGRSTSTPSSNDPNFYNQDATYFEKTGGGQVEDWWRTSSSTAESQLRFWPLNLGRGAEAETTRY